MKALTSLTAALAVLLLIGAACGGATTIATSTATPQAETRATDTTVPTVTAAPPTPTAVPPSPTPTEEAPTATPPPPTPVPPTATRVPPSPTPTEEADIRVIEVEARTYEFDPTEITLQKGEMVRFEITSPDIFHTFSLKRSEDATEDIVSVNVSPDEPGIIEFTAEEVGSFYLYCKPHEALDMTGTINVHE